MVYTMGPLSTYESMKNQCLILKKITRLRTASQNYQSQVSKFHISVSEVNCLLLCSRFCIGSVTILYFQIVSEADFSQCC